MSIFIFDSEFGWVKNYKFSIIFNDYFEDIPQYLLIYNIAVGRSDAILFPSLHVICSFFLESFLYPLDSEASQLCPCCESFSSLFWTFVLFNLENSFPSRMHIIYSVFSFCGLFLLCIFCLLYLELLAWDIDLQISQFSFIYLFDLLSKTFALDWMFMSLPNLYILKSYPPNMMVFIGGDLGR